MAAKRSPTSAERWEDFSRRGNCMCYPQNRKSRKLLQEMGLEGIEYRDFDPDFSPVAVDTVPIAHMTKYRTRHELLPGAARVLLKDVMGPDRKSVAKALADLSDSYAFEGNFEQADLELAGKWTREQKDGHDWSASDVKKYRQKNRLTWHERYDCVNMDLVPRAIHADFDHTGAVALLKEREKLIDECGDVFYGADDAPVSVYPDDAEGKDNMGNQRGYCPLHLVLTLGLIVGLGVTFFMSGAVDFVRILLWLLSSLCPFVLFLLLCYKCKGLPKILRNRVGGWILTVLFAVSLILVPQLAEFLYGLYLIALGYIVLQFVACFAPEGGTGTLTITRTDEYGHTTTETRTVYGDMDSAVNQAERDLRSEGYDEISRY